MKSLVSLVCFADKWKRMIAFKIARVRIHTQKQQKYLLCSPYTKNNRHSDTIE